MGEEDELSAETATVVRRSRPEDLDAWLALREAVAAEGRWIGHEAPVDKEASRAAFEYSLRAEDAASFVATSAGRLTGSVGMRLEHGPAHGVAELGMFVAAEHRGHGVGTALVEACLDWARTVGAHKVSLTVFPHNHAARALYTKFGFVTEGTLRRHFRRRSGQLWDAIVMALVLDTTSPGSQLDEPAQSRSARSRC